MARSRATAQRPPRRARPRRPTAPRRAAARRSAQGLALAVLLGLLLAAAAGAAPRFTGQVTDALRNPTHRLLASEETDRAVADLVFLDRVKARTKVRTCVRRRDGVRSCFRLTTAGKGVASVTPLRFARGRYVVRWRVEGEVVATWRFRVE